MLTQKGDSYTMETMRFYEKVLIEMNKKGWGIPRLHQEIVDQYGEEAIDYTTLWRALSGKTTLRRSNHFYLASALSTTPQVLRKGTNEEEKKSRYTYNDEAYLEYEKTPLPYLTAKLTLLANAKTEPESDPWEKGNLGTVPKYRFSDTTSNGVEILNHLIKNGILAEDPSGKIFFLRKKGHDILRPTEISTNNFDEIWTTLQQPTFTKWLHALYGETVCIVETPHGIQEFIIKAEAEGTIEKSKFEEADSNGNAIVEDLIKKEILEEAFDPQKVRLRRNNSEYIHRPYEIAESNFDQIWHVLQQFPSIYFDSTFPHHFENRSGKKAVCILVQSPKYLP